MVPSRLIAALLATLLFTTLTHAADRPFSHPDRIKYDSHCLIIDGKDTLIYSGAFHYFRCPKELWPERFQKIKDAGFNAVETYVAWNQCEPTQPASLSDFSKADLTDLDDFLAMAEQYGLYVIIRPGPYICAEWDNGGYPDWLSTSLSPRALRGDSPEYLAWCKHYYDEICPIIAKHQITKKQPGQPGVILFQIENEYDYNKTPEPAKINQLIALANDATADGIDVPLITCWTKQIRGVQDGPLRAVFDCVNCYPRWKVGDLRDRYTKLRTEQPDAPMATTELQGGWFSGVGGKLSEQQDGINAAQIQNITLFAWQMGCTLTNYYMLFGGTDLDDTAARGMTSSYDYAAPIRENGGVGDRYQRVSALGAFIREHGTSLARSETVALTSTTTQPDVEVAERRGSDGARYLFVRTGEHSDPRDGDASVKEPDGTAWTFHYQLEPFGSMVYYIPSGAKQGEWLPKPAPEIKRPTNLPAPIVISDAQTPLVDTPESLPDGAFPATDIPVKHGIHGSHFLYYKVSAKPGETVTFNVQPKDDLAATAGGKLLAATYDRNRSHISFTVPDGAAGILALYDNFGHSNTGGIGVPSGVLSIQGGTNAQFADAGDLATGIRNTAALNPRQDWKSFSIGQSPATESLSTWYRMKFDMAAADPAIWLPWHLHIEAKGNGFVYFNGHCIGRYWQAGPQHDFFLPGNWLHTGPGAPNLVALDLTPSGQPVSLDKVSVAPDAAFAEYRK